MFGVFTDRVKAASSFSDREKTSLRREALVPSCDHLPGAGDAPLERSNIVALPTSPSVRRRAIATKSAVSARLDRRALDGCAMRRVTAHSRVSVEREMVV